jgi:hypothetical protein
MDTSTENLGKVESILHDLKRSVAAHDLPVLTSLRIPARISHRDEFDRKKLEVLRRLRAKGLAVTGQRAIECPFVASIGSDILEVLIDDLKTYQQSVENGETPVPLVHKPVTPAFKPTTFEFWTPKRMEDETAAAWNQRRSRLQDWVDWFRFEGEYEVDRTSSPEGTISDLVRAVSPDWNGDASTCIANYFRKVDRKRRELLMEVNGVTNKKLVKRILKSEKFVHPHLKDGRVKIRKGQTFKKTIEILIENDNTGDLMKWDRFKYLIRKEYCRILEEEPCCKVLRDYRVIKRDEKLNSRKRELNVSKRDEILRKGTRHPKKQRRDTRNDKRNNGMSVIEYVKSLDGNKQRGAIGRLKSLKKNDGKKVCQVCGKKECEGIVWEKRADGSVRSQPKWNWTRCKEANRFEKDPRLPYSDLYSWWKAIQYNWNEYKN